MDHYNVEHIVVDERQRKEIKKAPLEELVNSILHIGLLHPIVLRDCNDEACDRASTHHKHLVAGERRLRAIQAIYEEGERNNVPAKFFHNNQPCSPPFIPFTDVGELSPIERREVELEENIRRLDLTWQEAALATAELVKLRQAQNPHASKASVAAEIADMRGEDPSDAKVYNKTNAEVSQAMVVANQMDREEVRNAKSLKEAYRVSLKESENFFAQHLSKTARPSPHEAIHGDSFEILPQLEAGKFHCIITDPPYGKDAGEEFGDRATLRHDYEDTREVAESCIRLLAKEGYRVTQPEAHLYMFCDIELFHLARGIFEAYGWWAWTTPLVWYKGAQGHEPYPDHGPRRSYETILYCIKGDKKKRSAYLDVLNYMFKEERDHAAQKPVELISFLIGQSTYPGDTVLDPFMGSGTIFPAAAKCQVQATGIEKLEQHYLTAARRLKELDL